MTGPFDFLTTLRSGDSGGATAGAAAVARLVASAAEIERPVSTLVAPISALRMRKVRRSTPAGTGVCARSSVLSGRVASVGILSSMWLPLGVLRGAIRHRYTLGPDIQTGNKPLVRSHGGNAGQ